MVKSEEFEMYSEQFAAYPLKHMVPSDTSPTADSDPQQT